MGEIYWEGKYPSNKCAGNFGVPPAVRSRSRGELAEDSTAAQISDSSSPLLKGDHMNRCGHLVMLQNFHEKQDFHFLSSPPRRTREHFRDYFSSFRFSEDCLSSREK